MSERIVGIDFGTSTTLMADRDGPGLARVLPLGRTLPWLPSIAGWSKGDELLVGEAAEGLGASRLIRSVKRNITGGKEIIRLALPGGGAVELETRDVVLAILKEATARASSQQKGFLKGRVQMGCPAMWDGDQRQLLASLAQEAGLPVAVADLVDEPIAAGVSWVWNRWQQDGERPHGNVLVLDYGGGTLDVALLEVTGDNVPEITVLAAAGVPQAGDSLDEAIAKNLGEDLRRQHIRINQLPDPEVAERLLVLTARQLKHALTELEDATALLGGDYGVPPLRYSRTALESAFAPQLDRAMRLVVGVLKSARLRQQGVSPDRVARLSVTELAKDVQYVLLAGGLSRVPAVRRRFVEDFPGAEVEHDTLLRTPEESVVSGLAFGEAYSRLNLDRPAFNLVVEYGEAGNEASPPSVVYRAFTPLYSPAEVNSGAFLLGHRAELKCPPGYFGLVRARLSCRATDGTVFDFRIGGKTIGAIELKVHTGVPGWIKLYADGRILLVDDNSCRAFRVTRWPVLRSKNHVVELEDITQNWWRDYDLPGWWHGGN